MIDYSIDNEGIATLEWNLPGRSQNVLNEASMRAFAEAADRAISDDGVKGIMLASAKRDFIAGGDLDQLLADSDAEKVFNGIRWWHGVLRHMETCGKPVAAAINGSALGGGLELALACHYRVAADKPQSRFGFPEVTLGLLPGAGGTQRAPRLMGIAASLPLLLEGRRIGTSEAQKAGLIHAIVEPGEERAAAKAWLLTAAAAQSKPQQAWDMKAFKIPGGGVMTAAGMQLFTGANAALREKTYGNYPAPRDILSCLFEGLQVDIDTGLKIESRYFAKQVVSPEAKNMIRSLFFGMNEANKLSGRPPDVPTQKFSRIGILGAGTMGAGIAHATAVSGIAVVLIDRTLAAAEKGKEYSQRLLERQVAKGRMSKAQMDAVLARIHPTADYADLEDCELVIEAVFEDRALKAEVTRRAEKLVAANAVFASNTSTLPITGLASASSRPEHFIGLHFFSPADKMPLVEIILGKESSPETLARSMDYVRAIGKTPIVVNDSRGFYTSRVFGTYLSEGMALLAEGVSPALIDNAGRIAGMPVGPLALADEVSLELIVKVGRQTQADLGSAYVEPASAPVARLMVEKLGRLGRKTGGGFYAYPADAKKHLWPDLGDHFPVRAEQPSLEEVVLRLILIQSVETVRCLEEKVLLRPIDADVGAILGWGYPSFRGGPIGWIQTFGLEKFVAECERLAGLHGPRFSPPQLLRDMAAKGENFYAN